MSKNPTPLERVRDFEREQAQKLSADERPFFHLTPLVGWMNDPNGFCWYKGQYHLFYQYHPFSRQWGPMHWGHAVSDDLLHWTYMPCALAPDTAADAGGCFSGSAVCDERNVAGFGKNAMVCFYTSAGNGLPESCWK